MLTSPQLRIVGIAALIVLGLIVIPFGAEATEHDSPTLETPS